MLMYSIDYVGESIPYKNPIMQSVQVDSNIVTIKFDMPVDVIAQPLRGPCPVANTSCNSCLRFVLVPPSLFLPKRRTFNVFLS